MPKLDTRLQGGRMLSQPLEFYIVDQTEDEAGAVVRTRQASPAYVAMGGIAPYLGLEQREALRTIGETWSTFTIRYHASRVPEEAMQVRVKLTGQFWEIRGVNHVAYERKTVELTCRLIK